MRRADYSRYHVTVHIHLHYLSRVVVVTASPDDEMPYRTVMFSITTRENQDATTLYTCSLDFKQNWFLIQPRPMSSVAVIGRADRAVYMSCTSFLKSVFSVAVCVSLLDSVSWTFERTDIRPP